jgi:iron complex transport system substrate-binding protein
VSGGVKAWRGLCAPFALLLSACIPASQAETPHPHPTIVSLNPCSDAILAEVADPAQVLAISHYSADPRSASMPAEQARRYRTTRGTLEEVLALHPDVVIDGSFIAPATRAAYSRLGLQLETLGIADDVDQARAQIRRIAELAGHPERGAALVARIDAALVQATPPDGEMLPAVMWQPGGIVPGDATLIADLMRRTGFSNFSATRGLRQADQLPLERVLADPPRVLLVAGDSRALSHPALNALHDTKRARFAANLLYCAGPTIIPAVERLAHVRRDVAMRMPTPNPSRKREGSQVALQSPLPLAGTAWGGPSHPPIHAKPSR